MSLRGRFVIFLRETGFKKRRYSKDQCLSNPENRDAQFNNLPRA
jgi:hypothetical protein